MDIIPARHRGSDMVPIVVGFMCAIVLSSVHVADVLVQRATLRPVDVALEPVAVDVTAAMARALGMFIAFALTGAAIARRSGKARLALIPLVAFTFAPVLTTGQPEPLVGFSGDWAWSLWMQAIFDGALTGIPVVLIAHERRWRDRTRAKGRPEAIAIVLCAASAAIVVALRQMSGSEFFGSGGTGAAQLCAAFAVGALLGARKHLRLPGFLFVVLIAGTPDILMNGVADPAAFEGTSVVRVAFDAVIGPMALLVAGMASEPLGRRLRARRNAPAQPVVAATMPTR